MQHAFLIKKKKKSIFTKLSFYISTLFYKLRHLKIINLDYYKNYKSIINVESPQITINLPSDRLTSSCIDNAWKKIEINIIAVVTNDNGIFASLVNCFIERSEQNFIRDY